MNVKYSFNFKLPLSHNRWFVVKYLLTANRINCSFNCYDSLVIRVQDNLM